MPKQLGAVPKPEREPLQYCRAVRIEGGGRAVEALLIDEDDLKILHKAGKVHFIRASEGDFLELFAVKGADAMRRDEDRAKWTFGEAKLRAMK